MNIEFDVYKQKLNEAKPQLEELAKSLNLEGLKNELERLHAMQEAPGFYIFSIMFFIISKIKSFIPGFVIFMIFI